MKFLIYLLIIVILFLFFKNREHFYGMNYIQKHEYLKCCNALGCQHPTCQIFLSNNMSTMRLIGVAYQNNGMKNKIHKIYARKNGNSRNYDYFIKVYNNDGDYLFNKLNIKYLHNGDKITINNNTYVVSLYESLYDKGYFDKFYTKNYYTSFFPNYGTSFGYPGNIMKHGYIIDNNKKDYSFIFKKNTGRNRWKYYMKKANALIPLEKYENKYISDNDFIKSPIDNKKYKFKKFDN